MTLKDSLEQLKCFEASELPCSYVWLLFLFLPLLKPLISVRSFDLRFQTFHSTIGSVVNLFSPFLSISVPEQGWSSPCSCSGERLNRSVERILWSSTAALPSPANSASLTSSCQVRHQTSGKSDRLSWVQWGFKARRCLFKLQRLPWKIIYFQKSCVTMAMWLLSGDCEYESQWH